MRARLAMLGAGAVALVVVAVLATALVLRGHYQVTDDRHVLSALPADTRSSISNPVSVLVWNIYKARRVSWQRDLHRLGAGADLVLLQEAVTTGEMLAGLRAMPALRWDFAASFDYDDGRHATGVMTGAQAAPQAVEYLRSPGREPLVGTPKMTLVTLYRLENDGQVLLVANTHAQLAVSTPDFARQLEDVAARIARHVGPVLWAGDFNTWTGTRSDIMDQLAHRLALTPVRIRPDERTSTFGHVIDRAYIRGLEAVASRAHPEVDGSDHVPFTFELVLDPRHSAAPGGGAMAPASMLAAHADTRP